MTRSDLSRLAIAATLSIVTTLPGSMAMADTLDLAFMPPAIEPQDICITGASPDPLDDLSIEDGDGGLTDELRLQYIQRDIRNLQAEDADRWFDFIITLIDWQATLDPAFAGTGATLAKIALYIDAGRLPDLQSQGLIEQVRQSSDQITNAQRMALAQYYLNGIGVAQDLDFARSLIRDAAYGGNPDALMSLARFELQGDPVPGWDAPLDMTVTLAFGGMLGQMDNEVCRHAERIAQEYLNGDVVTRNPEIAYAWFKFAADLGGASGAWRVVEFHLEADAARKDNAEMLRYLQMAVERGITLDAVQAERIRSESDVDEAQLRQILGFNFSADTGRTRPSLSPYFQLAVNLDGEDADEDDPYLDYLRELTAFDTAPGWVFTTLANEVLVRVGRWAGEAEALTLLEEAAARQDAEGMQLLAKLLIRQRDNPAQVNRAVNLLTEAVSRYGLMSAMQDLDTLYRCQANDAPRLREADLWATNYRATQSDTISISPTDLISLDPFKDPETLAQIQSQALRGDVQSLANFVERVQLDPLATDDAQRLWASRLDSSDKALELFAELEFTLATNAVERDLAVELFRRIYLNNGVTTALDLSVALVEDNGRVPAVGDEIIQMLATASNRGEGASIRLLSRLLADSRSELSVFQEYEQVIEDRGDFIALMFAIPYVSADKAGDYVDRAVSLMACGTKDVAELADAHTIMLAPDLVYHWQQIGLTIPNGNVLAKLGISDRQMSEYGIGPAPSQVEVFERNLADGDLSARRNLYALTADPDLQSYDPAAATEHLLALLAAGGADDEAFILTSFRTANAEVRDLVSARFDMADLYLKAAQRGDVTAKREYALLLRTTARTFFDLQTSARWLQEAADGGDVIAMAELGNVLAYGLGVEQDVTAALAWLEQAERGGNVEAADLARLLRLSVTQ